MSTYPYNYDDLLYRLHLVKMAEDNYKKINLPAIKITKKNKISIFINFSNFVEKLKRTPEHISNYIREETGMATSVNAQDQMIIQGILNETKTETIMRNYIREYVSCRQCKCLDTNLIKENTITFILCNQCGAKTSLGRIHKN